MTFIFFTFFHYFLNVYNEHVLLVKSGKKLTLKKRKDPGQTTVSGLK